MSTTEEAGSVQLADYGRLLRRRWLTVALSLLIGAAAGLVAMLTIPPTYESSASVLVLPTDVRGQEGNVVGGRTQNAVNLDTEAQLVTSAGVAGAAKKLIRAEESSTDLAERVEITVPPNSSVLTITYADNSPERAARGAHAFADAYLTNREETAEKTLADRAEALRKRRADLREKVADRDDELDGLPDGSTEKRLTRTEVNGLNAQLSDVGEQLASLQDQEVNPGRIITDAAPPLSPSQPLPVLFLVSGAALGLLAGVFLAVLKDRNDHRIRGGSDVTGLLDLPVLADITLPNRGSAWRNLLPVRSGAAQEVRQLQHVVAGADQKAVLVTTASTGPAAQLLAANLTAALARSGRTVAHVCADLATTTSATMLGAQTGPGLAEVLLSNKSIDEVLQHTTGSSRIRVLSPGLRAGEVGDALPTDGLAAVVHRSGERFDHVVIEAPATAVTADAQAWAQFSDTAVVAVQRLHTRREDALDAVNQMERVGCAVLGLVVLPWHGKTDFASASSSTYATAQHAHELPGQIADDGKQGLAADGQVRVGSPDAGRSG